MVSSLFAEGLRAAASRMALSIRSGLMGGCGQARPL